MLTENVPGHWSHDRVQEATGWNKRKWLRYRSGEVSSLKTIAEIAWVVGLKSTVLMGGSPEDIVGAPIPAWDWLADYEWHSVTPNQWDWDSYTQEHLERSTV
jgi:hypothetical protein